VIKQNVVDSVLKSAIGKMQDEAAALIGEEIRLSELSFNTHSKESIFEIPRDKCALSRLEASGDFSGEAYLVFPLKDAVLLGAKLIMLPEEEIAEKVKNPQFDGEEADAWGEVANIIVGALTASIEELFPKKLHFKRTVTEPLISTKVDVESDAPFPPGNYHVATAKVGIGHKELGDLELIFPLEVLGMETPPAPSAAAEAPPAEKTESKTAGQSAANGEKTSPGQQSTAQNSEERAAATKVAAAPQEPAREPSGEEAAASPAEPASEPESGDKPAGTIPQATVNKILETAFKEIAKDVSDLIAQQVTCEKLSYSALSKEEYFALPRDKAAMARMAASGEAQGEAYLLARQKDAILLGGKLIMLPEDEIEAKVKEANFGEEDRDAYGEVANIITGSLTKILDDLYPRKLHLKRTEVEAIVPTKVDVDGSDPFAPGQFYLGSCKLALEGKELGELDLLFPLDLLGIKLDIPESGAEPKEKGSTTAGRSAGEGLKEGQKRTEAAQEGSRRQAAVHQNQAEDSKSAGSGGRPAETQPADPTPHVLVVAENDELAAMICTPLKERGLPYRCLSFKDDVRQCAREIRISGAILAMSEVADQGFALAIKVCPILAEGAPMIIAGPEWTRTLVLKAVRYGACDILVTPAGAEEVQAKIDEHLAERLAANQ